MANSRGFGFGREVSPAVKELKVGLRLSLLTFPVGKATNVEQGSDRDMQAGLKTALPSSASMFPPPIQIL